MTNRYNLRKRISKLNSEEEKEYDEGTKKVKLISHAKFHNALEKTSINNVRKLLKSVQLCNEHCYFIAQSRDNPDFLTALLEYDSSGINAVDSKGDSLLIRDIRDYECKHFQLLTDKGADVNYCNDADNEEHTALHYATINKNISVEVIKKLIELKADVNKELKLKPILYYDIERENRDNGNTPLLCLLKNYDNNNGLEKIKLIIDAGADINKCNTFKETPLMFAVSIDVTSSTNILELIKYLLDNGAIAGKHDKERNTAINNLILTLHEVVDTEKDIELLINEYYIPATNLLIEAGEDLFISCNGEPLIDNVFTIYEKKFQIRALLLHLLKVEFNTFEKCNLEPCEFFHPLVSVLYNLNVINKDSEVFMEKVTNLIFHHPTNAFKFYPTIITAYLNDCEFEWSSLGINGNDFPVEICVSVVGMFVAQLPLEDLKKWLVKLRDEKFNLKHDCPLVLILSLRFLKENMSSKISELLMEVVDFLLENNIPISTAELYLEDELLSYLQTIFQIPDCIWVSALFGNLDYLKKFLPYWNQHPLTVLLFLCPWKETDINLVDKMLKVIEKILPLLIKIGGHIPHGTTLHNLIEQWMTKLRITCNHSSRIQPANSKSLICNKILKLCDNKNVPVSLKVMCRTIIRANAVGHGNNLPNYLKSLVPPGLKDFISLNVEC